MTHGGMRFDEVGIKPLLRALGDMLWIEALGGHLRVDSPLGAGTRLPVTLPLNGPDDGH
jgi:hypothetical protein